MTKLISIIIPSYNMERYLGNCLESLSPWLRSDSPVEILVVNDGSTDRTSEIAHGYAERFPEVVRVIDKPNGHYGSAVNAGLAAATGNYVKNLDADDTFDKEALAQLIARLERDRTAGEVVDLYLTDFIEVEEDGREMRRVTQDLPVDRPVSVLEIAGNARDVTMHSCMWRRELLLAIGYRQTEGIPYSDVEWVLYPMLSAGSVRYVPVFLYRYLLGRAGQSVSLAERVRNARVWDVLLGRIRREMLARMNDLDEGQRKFLLRVAVDMARMRQEVAFALRPFGEAGRLLADFICEIEKERPGFHAQVEDAARIMKSSLNLPYLRIWRKLPFGKSAWMLLVRAYLSVTRW